MLASRLIECYTNEDQRVIFDPFGGVGSTLVAAKELGKQGIGVEISPEFVNIALARIGQVIPFNGGDSVICTGDSRELDQYVESNSVDMVVTSPPYWDILLRKRTCDGKPQRDYGDAAGDLGKIEFYDDFLAELSIIFGKVFTVLKGGSYCCVVVKDFQKEGTFYPFHMSVIDLMTDIGFKSSGIVIWDRRADYNAFRPIGYPSVFYLNNPYEFILVFRRQDDGEIDREAD